MLGEIHNVMRIVDPNTEEVYYLAGDDELEAKQSFGTDVHIYHCEAVVTRYGSDMVVQDGME